jgi:hypothetical protein
VSVYDRAPSAALGAAPVLLNVASEFDVGPIETGLVRAGRGRLAEAKGAAASAHRPEGDSDAIPDDSHYSRGAIHGDLSPSDIGERTPHGADARSLAALSGGGNNDSAPACTTGHAGHLCRI